MKNLIIIIAAIALLSCKKNEDYRKDEWKMKGVNFSVYGPDSTTLVKYDGIYFTNKEGLKRWGTVRSIALYRNEQQYKDHTDNFKVVNGYIVDNYPPLYATGLPFNNKSPEYLDIVGMPSGTYFLVLETDGDVHFTNKYLTYNADVSQGYTFFKLYLERGKYVNGQLTF